MNLFVQTVQYSSMTRLYIWVMAIIGQIGRLFIKESLTGQFLKKAWKGSIEICTRKLQLNHKNYIDQYM